MQSFDSFDLPSLVMSLSTDPGLSDGLGLGHFTLENGQEFYDRSFASKPELQRHERNIHRRQAYSNYRSNQLEESSVATVSFSANSPPYM